MVSVCSYFLHLLSNPRRTKLNHGRLIHTQPDVMLPTRLRDSLPDSTSSAPEPPNKPYTVLLGGESGFWLQGFRVQPKTLRPKSETHNPKPQTQNPPNPKPHTESPKPRLWAGRALRCRHAEDAVGRLGVAGSKVSSGYQRGTRRAQEIFLRV